jgi:hypothetical protein
MTTFPDALLYFADYEHCKEFLAPLRWPAGVRCPVCRSKKIYFLRKNRVWKCVSGHPKPRFSLKTGTILQDSAVPIEKWLPVIWMVLNQQDDISSVELHRVLGVTQKTAWFMVHRIRTAMRSRAYTKPLYKTKGVPPAAPAPTHEFHVMQQGMRRLLRVRKPELNDLLIQAKSMSPRTGNPNAPGRKRKQL